MCDTTWVKKFDTIHTSSFEEYSNQGYFSLVANVVLDNELFSTGKKKRNTLIQFVPTVSKELFNEKCEWLYLFTINNKIVKIGGTRVGLKGRTSSYLCGHHVKERGKSGDCSKTNAYIYNTFEFYLREGYKIDMYGYKLPIESKFVSILGDEIKIIVQTFHAYESIFLEKYKKECNKYPILNDNCDPNYKTFG